MTGDGERRDYRCFHDPGKPHKFSVLMEVADRPVPAYSPPPRCTTHPKGRVVRDGWYGPKLTPEEKASPEGTRHGRRQRYRCYPPGTQAKAFRNGWHTFTPDLPREHVCAGEVHCDECEELRGVHRGENAVARRQSWPLRVVAEGLGRLANGETYSEVGEWAWRVTGRTRSRPAALTPEERLRRKRVKEHKRAVREAERDGLPVRPWPDDLDEEPVGDIEGIPVRRRRTDADGNVLAPRRKTTARSSKARNRWHTAADWVEMYAAVLWDPLHARLLAAERQAHEVRADGGPARPSMLLIDDIPVNARVRDPDTGKVRSRRAYFVLGAATVTWPDDPFAFPDDRDTKLRMLRAFPSNEATAWMLLFDELGFVPGAYEPDYLLADAGTGLRRAVAEYFTTTVVIPSLFHIHQAIDQALGQTPGAKVDTPAGTRTHPDLAAHVATLDGDALRSMTPADWSAWWDALESHLVRLQLPVEKVRLRRDNYEDTMRQALPHIKANPGLPVSTGGFEKVLRRTAQRVLTERRHSFANVERTNHLLDLVVARDHGLFDKVATTVAALRGDQAGHDGWAAPPRAVADPQPPMPGRYSSLRDPQLLPGLAPTLSIAVKPPRKKRKAPSATSAVAPATPAAGPAGRAPATGGKAAARSSGGTSRRSRKGATP